MDADGGAAVTGRGRPVVRVGALLLTISAIAAALLVVSPPSAELVATGNAQALVGPTRTAKANLVSISNSGIRGNVWFEDDGTRLEVTGSARGFIPQRRYFTLVYGVKSQAPGEGSNPCGRDDTLNFEQMLVAEWLPAGGRTRTLATPAPKLTVGLEQIRTVSIRQLTAPLLPDVTQDFPPQAFELRSCGLIQPTN
jgi:hypothetical protein